MGQAGVSEKQKLRFSDLSLRSVTFEVRYEPALLFWDRAGHIWEDIRTSVGNVKLKSAEPGNTVFEIGRDISVAVGLEMSHVTSFNPNSKLDELSEVVDKIVGVLIRHLRIVKFTRVGGRFVYLKDYPEADLAVNALLSLGNIFTPDGRHFGIAGKPGAPDYKMRWESDAVGIYIQLGASTRKLEFEAPRESKVLRSTTETQHIVSYDLDYYTRAPVEVEKLRVKDWLENVAHVIRRDSKIFFERSSEVASV